MKGKFEMKGGGKIGKGCEREEDILEVRNLQRKNKEKKMGWQGLGDEERLMKSKEEDEIGMIRRGERGIRRIGQREDG